VKLFRIAVRKREVENEPKRIKEEEGHDSLFNIKTKEYYDKWNEVQKEYNWDKLQNDTFSVTLGGGRVVKMTGKEVVDNINGVISKWNKKIHGWMTGGRESGINEWDRTYSPLKGKKDYTGDKRMAYENIILNDDTATLPSKAEVDAKIQEIKDEDTVRINKKASGKQKLKDLGLDDDEIKALTGA